MTDDDRQITGENRQGGVGLGDDQHRITPDIARGDRAAEAVVAPTDEDPIGRVQFSQPASGPIAPQMIDDHGEARPESSFGDVAEVPTGASVWEALGADDGPAIRSGQPMPPAEALDRAREPGYAPEPLGKNDIDDSREDDGL
jgi:hypothetical protein